MRSILVIDDERSMCEFFELFLSSNGYLPVIANGGEEGLKKVRTEKYDLVITDLKMPVVGGIEILKEVKTLHPDCPVIAITAYASPELAAQAMMLGAQGYLPKPFSNDLVLATIREAMDKLELIVENRKLKQTTEPSAFLDAIVGNSVPIEKLKEIIKKVAASNANVLIIGESGTGKELAARAIHELSGRAKKPFIPFNCGAIPQELFESELFGYEKGAFTGAEKNKAGIIEEAAGGTIFLDEVAEFPLLHQVKLLRVLQEKEIMRVGATKSKKIDVRILAATNQSLVKMVKSGDFREDLFYRLNVIEISIPPLRERREDIPIIAGSLIKKIAKKNQMSIKTISQEAIHAFENYSWKGNVRELENVLERSIVLEAGDVISAENLPECVIGFQEEEFQRMQGSCPLDLDLDEALNNLENRLILETFKRYGGNLRQIAKKLNITVRSLRYRLKKYNISFKE